MSPCVCVCALIFSPYNDNVLTLFKKVGLKMYGLAQAVVFHAFNS